MNKVQLQIGDLIHQKRYDYRGVVVQIDDGVARTNSGTQLNQTQPGRDQPWYRVLVDGATHTTYVALKNLERDTSGELV